MADALIYLSVFSLPFTYALTFDVGFPLKVYEIGFCISALYFLFKKRSVFGNLINDPLSRCMVFFLLYAGVNLLVRIFFPAPGMMSEGFTPRFGIVGDPIAKLLYLFLAFVVYRIIMYYSSTGRTTQLITSWLCGGVIAAAYSWYTFLCSLMELKPFLLPGMNQGMQRVDFMSHEFVRSGCFLEANFLGLYLITTIILSLFQKRYFLAIFFMVTSLLTFSSITFITLNILIIATIFWLIRNRRVRSGCVAALVFVLFQYGLLRSQYTNVILLNKIIDSKTDVYVCKKEVVSAVAARTTTLDEARKEGRNAASSGPGHSALPSTVSAFFNNKYAVNIHDGDKVSKYDRLNQIGAGVKIFLSHPFLGVGLARFGYYFDRYKIREMPFHAGSKMIANNVFVEVLSELGAPGFLIFVGILVLLFSAARRTRSFFLMVGVSLIFMYFFFYPTYSLLFIWVFGGIVSGLASPAHCAYEKDRR